MRPTIKTVGEPLESMARYENLISETRHFIWVAQQSSKHAMDLDTKVYYQRLKKQFDDVLRVLRLNYFDVEDAQTIVKDFSK